MAQGHYDAGREREAPQEPNALIVQAVIGLPVRLKAHRAARHLSQREVAKRSGISFATVSRIEAGEDHLVSNLIAIAAYLDGAQ